MKQKRTALRQMSMEKIHIGQNTLTVTDQGGERISQLISAQLRLTFALVGGGYFDHTNWFGGNSGKLRRAAPPFFAYLLIHQFRIFPRNFSPRSSQVRSRGQVSSSGQMQVMLLKRIELTVPEAAVLA